MSEFLFISERISKSIIYPDDQTHKIHITQNILKNIKSILKSNPNVFTTLLLFLSLTDWNRISTFLKKYNSDHMDYRCILITSSTDIDLQLFSSQNIFAMRTTSISASEFQFLIKKAFYQMQKKHKDRVKDIDFAKLKDTYYDQQLLISIGKRLTAEKDQNKLLETILTLSKKITCADAGSIYIVEKTKNREKILRFYHSQTYSKNISYKKAVIPINKNSIAGYVALTGEILNIDDVYNLPDKKIPGVSHNHSFDRKNNYKSKSILTVPIKNHLDEIVGVIQLVNCKKGYHFGDEAFNIKLVTLEDFHNKVFPFDAHYENLMQAVSSQAGIAIENMRMIKQIQSQLKEFVKASVAAVEAQDPSTSGHSLRVASMCIETARAINESNDKALKEIRLNEAQIKELEYAALLHDFGKANIDFRILLKAKKLFPKDYNFLQLKLDYLYQYIKSKHLEEKITFFKELSLDGNNKLVNKSLIKEIDTELNRIKNVKSMIEKLNEPNIHNRNQEKLFSDVINILEALKCFDMQGNKIEIFDDEEQINLAIPKGSLNSKERLEIESHVLHSYNFVKQIPWTPDLQNIPEIIYKHHERLDGSGYPQKLEGKKDIPIQVRIIVIADMFDALTAADRPYKNAVSAGEAIQILKEEASNNKIDKNLLAVFIKNKIYEKTKSAGFY